MSNSVPTSTATNVSEKFTGRVKWFNNKAGYGFITVTDGSKSGTDIFVHHTSIKVDSDQYKYLVNGEYVEFYLSQTTSGEHEYQAENVCGIKGGKLMCETRNEMRISRGQYHSDKHTSTRQQKSQHHEKSTGKSEKVEISVPTPKSVRAPSSKPQTKSQSRPSSTQTELSAQTGQTRTSTRTTKK